MITALTPGEPNVLDGSPPDRICRLPTRAELHNYPAASRPRARVLICPGGGYLQLMHDKEGVELAQWLSAQGFDAHVLVHRLPGQNGQPFDIALSDAQLALQHLATLPPMPLFLMGLSSGGHLAGTLACQPEASAAKGVLIAYAPVNANHRGHKAPAGKPDYPPPEKQAFYDAWPIGITAEPHGMPKQPVFLAYALHDAIVPIEHALNFIRSARDAGRHLDAHVFNDAPHGFALRELEGAQRSWPALALDWMDRRLPA